MAAKNFQLDQESGYEESTMYQQEDEYEAEETLSLCDLPIYSSHSAQSDVYSKEDGPDSSSCNNDGNGDDFFEFFSEDFTATTPANAEKKYIVFCGKTIPYKEDSQKGLSFQGSPKLQRKTENNYNFPYLLKRTKPYSVGKVSSMKSYTKSRWFLFVFGMSRSPAKMDLGDIRRRQSRKVTASKMFPPAEQGEAVKSNGGRWGRIRSLLGLGRKNKHPDDVVKGSFVGA